MAGAHYVLFCAIDLVFNYQLQDQFFLRLSLVGIRIISGKCVNDKVWILIENISIEYFRCRIGGSESLMSGDTIGLMEY